MENLDFGQVWSKSMDMIKSQLDPQIFAAWIQPLLLMPAAGLSSEDSSSDERISRATVSNQPESDKPKSNKPEHDKNGNTAVDANQPIDGTPATESPSSETRAISIAAPNKFCCDHVQRYYGDIINTALASASGLDSLSVNYTVSPIVVASKDFSNTRSGNGELENGGSLSGHSFNARRRLVTKRNLTKSDGGKNGENSNGTLSNASSRLNPDFSSSNLNQNYNFSNFVVGSCNQFAHAVSLQVAQNLGSSYNPLFIYGGVGLGKTHLVNAIGNYAHRFGKKALLVSSEIFVNELISAIRSNKMQQFKDRFRSLDLLVIDDIQFLKGKERTQEEFFHTFNELHQRRKQIVLTSDKVPQELIDLEERLRTRFSSGLSADLQAPDFETRVAILTQKAEALGIAIPENVVGLIAEKIDTNVRELEGALNRLHAFSAMRNQAIDVDLATEALRTFFPESNRDVNVEVIQETLAKKYSVSRNDILGKRRTHNIAAARQIAMFLSRRMTGASFPEIGALFGGRDHSTVIHACKTVEERISEDVALRSEIESLEKKIRS